MALAMVLVAPTPVEAEEEPLVTDRPDVAEASETVGRGRFQLETALGLERDSADGVTTTVLNTPLKLRFGITDRVEAHIEAAGFMQSWEQSDGSDTVASSGVGDLDVGFKAHFMDGGGLVPSVGLLVALTVPAGSSPFSDGEVALSPTLAADWELPAELGIGSNLGLTFTLTDSAAEAQSVRFALALGRSWAPLTERLGTYIEVFGELPMGGGEHAISVDGGFTYLLTPNLKIDIAAAAGLTGPAADFSTALGLSYRH